MVRTLRPHLLGIDDGPFDKRRDERVPVVGVLMEGADLIEAVAVADFAIDGEEATEFLVEWIRGLPFASGLHGIVLGGITIAGLGVIDLEALSRALSLPAIAVNRQQPSDEPLERALDSAGLRARRTIVKRTPRAWQYDPGLWVAHAGGAREEIEALLRASIAKSRLPEPLRVAHMIAAAVVTGNSRSRP